MLREISKELNEKTRDTVTAMVKMSIDSDTFECMSHENFSNLKLALETLDLALKLNQELCRTIDEMNGRIRDMDNNIDVLVKVINK